MMDRMLQLMAERKASDLFLSPNSPVMVKINGVVAPVSEQRLSAKRVNELIKEIVSEEDWATFVSEKELTTSYGIAGVGAFRVNLFRQRGSTSVVIRFIPGEIPSSASLNLPPFLNDLIVQKRGLILVVGATGSGKSTTLASLLDYRNAERAGHILTIEDPIEFNFRNRRSIVNQRQIGTDTESLNTALRSAMRQAPDCILIGEIRDPRTMSQAIAYAQSGHLVAATMHANNAYHALTRVVSFFPPENRRIVLSDLAATLRAVISQRLVRTVEDTRIPAIEVLLNTTHIAELIEHSRIAEIKEAMEKSIAAGSVTFEQALVRLVSERRITRDEALLNSDSPTNLL
ncbi:MAG: PilT/PilU family type 4a pilus ATPase, partial [Burkholderiaceae bacterium]|nr:PilT/PilU family type 4a pilus ATPase [Burkholderiaceae bacterium]